MVEEYKLPLRHWLVKQTDAKRFHGLEWAMNTKGQQCIKIPWIQQHHPDWQRSYELFVAWAKHKDHEIENPPNYKKLKGNFRCAMRKSNDFEEVENEKTLQRGNFKLYRLLTKEEVEKRKQNKEKKPKRSSEDTSLKAPAKRQLSASFESVSTPRSCFTNPQTPISVCPPDLQGNLIWPSFSQAPMNNPFNHTRQANSPFNQSMLVNSPFNQPQGVSSPMLIDASNTPTTVTNKSSFSVSHRFGIDDNHLLQKDPESLEHLKKAFVQEADDFDMKNESSKYSPSTQLSPCYEMVTDEDHLYSLACSSSYTSLLNSNYNTSSHSRMASYETHSLINYILMRNPKIELDSNFSEFVLEIIYENAPRKEIFLNFHQHAKGFRLMYGDIKQQAEVFRQRNKLDMLQYTPVALPKHPTSDTVNKILDNVQQGLMFEYNKYKGVVICTRKCMSGVYYCSSDRPIDLQRGKPCVIFDYAAAVQNWRDRKRSSHLYSELVLGTKPHHSKPLRLKIRPKVATWLIQSQARSSASETPSINIDCPNTIDKEIQKLRLC